MPELENNSAAAAAAAGSDPPQKEEQNLSLSERYDKAVNLCESSPVSAIEILEPLQHEIARLSLFSLSSGESLQDISTKSLPLLALEHFLALAYTRLPTGPGQMSQRRQHLIKSMDLWTNFLQTLESLASNSTDEEDGARILSAAEQKEYHTLIEYTSHLTTSDGDNNSKSTLPPALAAPRREDKIARFQAKQQAQQQVQRLKSLRERRSRLGMAAEEVLDDFDEETLDRSVAMTNLLLAKAEALDEWASSLRELPMIERMVQMEAQRQQMDKHSGNSSANHNSTNNNNDHRQKRPPAPSTGLQVTHITLDSNTNQLQFRKEEIKSQVFRPGWNQPTMSLDELAHRERDDAIEREERQKQTEAANKNDTSRPRRYEQLVKDGLEDHADAVDATAAVDRAWDEWKEENPRGSGNKHGDQGDRNF